MSAILHCEDESKLILRTFAIFTCEKYVLCPTFDHCLRIDTLEYMIQDWWWQMDDLGFKIIDLGGKRADNTQD